HHEDALVALHLAAERLVEGLGHRDLAPGPRRRLADLGVGRVHGRFHQLHGGLGARLRELDRAVELELDRLLELLEAHRRRALLVHQTVAAARAAMDAPAVVRELAVESAYWLFSQRKMIGSAHTAARFSASWTTPWLAPPSPKKAMTTLSVFLSFDASAAPVPMGTPAATIP